MYNMFTEAGNAKVAQLVDTARQLAGVDGPANAAVAMLDLIR